MSKTKQIKWLNRFIALWDANTENHNERHVNWLGDIYKAFIAQNQLPPISADELVFRLSRL